MPLSTARPRVLARRMVIGVVVVGLIGATIVAVAWLVLTSESYQRKADNHARKAALHESNRAGMVPPWSDAEARLAEYHSWMNRKWEYAASHPWLAVEPDPPRPK